MIYVDQFPSSTTEGGGCDIQGETIALEVLGDTLRTRGFYEVGIDQCQRYLRHYHYKRGTAAYWMFFNEHPHDTLDITVALPNTGKAATYDARTNTLWAVDAQVVQDGTQVRLQLPAYDSMVLVFDESLPEVQQPIYAKAMRHVEGAWHISTASAETYPAFLPVSGIQKLVNMSLAEHLPRFSGTFRYEIGFTAQGDESVLDLGVAYEVAEVFFNNTSAGVRIAPPYRFDIAGLVKPGDNWLCVEVINTLVQQQHDYMSISMPHEPTGLLGPVMVG